MTKLLEQAFEALGRMPPDMQNEIARALLGMAKPGSMDVVEPEHVAAVSEGMEQASRGEFAVGTAEEIVAAAFRRHQR